MKEAIEKDDTDTIQHMIEQEHTVGVIKKFTFGLNRTKTKQNILYCLNNTIRQTYYNYTLQLYNIELYL